jgi:hypothetical protein
MKVVQVGILIALIGVGALLFMVWRGQQPAAAPVPLETQPAITNAPAPETPPAALTQPAERNTARPSPAQRRTTAVTPAPPRTEPQPAEAVRETPVPATPQTAESVPAPTPAPVVPALPAEPPAPPPPQPRTVTIAAGTLLSARLLETLSTDKVKPGDTFMASLDKAFTVDGMVIAERGARVEGRVVESQEAGRIKGVSNLAIQLVRLNTSDGQHLTIQTDVFRKAGETTRGQDAAKVGGGAGLGAVIGAIAGGGKGAAIGAAVGGAAGAGTVAATRGKATVLPVETRIDFRISNAVTLTERK